MLTEARLDAFSKLKSSWGFEFELQTNPMPFHLDSPWGATLMPLRAHAMDWDGTEYGGWVKAPVQF